MALLSLNVVVIARLFGRARAQDVGRGREWDGRGKCRQTFPAPPQAQGQKRKGRANKEEEESVKQAHTHTHHLFLVGNQDQQLQVHRDDALGHETIEQLNSSQFWK